MSRTSGPSPVLSDEERAHPSEEWPLRRTASSESFTTSVARQPASKPQILPPVSPSPPMSSTPASSPTAASAPSSSFLPSVTSSVSNSAAAQSNPPFSGDSNSVAFSVASPLSTSAASMLASLADKDWSLYERSLEKPFVMLPSTASVHSDSLLSEPTSSVNSPALQASVSQPPSILSMLPSAPSVYTSSAPPAHQSKRQSLQARAEAMGLSLVGGALPPPMPLLPTRAVTLSLTAQNLPAKSGTNMIFGPAPRHIQTMPAAREPLYQRENNQTKDVFQAKMQRWDKTRFVYPERHINRVVYDCIDDSPFIREFNKRQADGTSNTVAGAESEAESDEAQVLEEVSIAVDVTDRGLAPRGSPQASTGSPSATNPLDHVLPAQGRRVPGELTPFYLVTDPEDTVLEFESRFESGNLRRAIQVFDYEYDMIIKPDINTRRHTQWFYFRVRNTRPGTLYKFNFINLAKVDSLYNYGMRPLMYSETDARTKGVGWVRCGRDICYYQNHIKRRNNTFYYSFTFSVEFEHADDTVYFAYSYPYTYTDLQLYLQDIENDPERSRHVKRRSLCNTLAGNGCDLLTITSFEGTDLAERIARRRGVVVSARVHPGEANASWIMKGVIDFLLSSNPAADLLRRNFVFKIVPMLNPDGVINGNYRCSLAGVDLNRQWTNPSKQLMPTIFHLKEMIRRFGEDRELVLYCDMHGHSRSSNIFIYGCDDPRGENPNRLLARVFPHLLWKSCSYFSFKDCNFKIQRSKESTARVVVHRELGVMNSFTLEASFAGANRGVGTGMHFNTLDLDEMARRFCECIVQYCDSTNAGAATSLRELKAQFPPEKCAKEDEDDDQGSDFGGNESEELETATGTAVDRNRKAKARRKKSGPPMRTGSATFSGVGPSASTPTNAPPAQPIPTLTSSLRRKKLKPQKPILPDAAPMTTTTPSAPSFMSIADKASQPATPSSSTAAPSTLGSHPNFSSQSSSTSLVPLSTTSASSWLGNGAALPYPGVERTSWSSSAQNTNSASGISLHAAVARSTQDSHSPPPTASAAETRDDLTPFLQLAQRMMQAHEAQVSQHPASLSQIQAMFLAQQQAAFAQSPVLLSATTAASAAAAAAAAADEASAAASSSAARPRHGIAPMSMLPASMIPTSMDEASEALRKARRANRKSSNALRPTTVATSNPSMLGSMSVSTPSQAILFPSAMASAASIPRVSTASSAASLMMNSNFQVGSLSQNRKSDAAFGRPQSQNTPFAQYSTAVPPSLLSAAAMYSPTLPPAANPVLASGILLPASAMPPSAPISTSASALAAAKLRRGSSVRMPHSALNGGDQPARPVVPASPSNAKDSVFARYIHGDGNMDDSASAGGPSQHLAHADYGSNGFDSDGGNRPVSAANSLRASVPSARHPPANPISSSRSHAAAQAASGPSKVQQRRYSTSGSPLVGSIGFEPSFVTGLQGNGDFDLRDSRRGSGSNAEALGSHSNYATSAAMSSRPISAAIEASKRDLQSLPNSMRSLALAANAPQSISSSSQLSAAAEMLSRGKSAVVSRALQATRK